MPQPLALGFVACFLVALVVVFGGLVAIARMFWLSSQMDPVPKATLDVWRLDRAAERLRLEVVEGDPATSIQHLGYPDRTAFRARLRGAREDGLEVQLTLAPGVATEGEAVLTAADHVFHRSDNARRAQHWGYRLPYCTARLSVSGPIAIPAFELTIRPLPAEVGTAGFAAGALAAFTGGPLTAWRNGFVPAMPRLGGLAASSFGDPDLDTAFVLSTNDPSLGARLAPIVREMRSLFFEELCRGVVTPETLQMNPYCPHIWGTGDYVTMQLPDLFAGRVFGAGQLDGLLAIARAHRVMLAA